MKRFQPSEPRELLGERLLAILRTQLFEVCVVFQREAGLSLLVAQLTI